MTVNLKDVICAIDIELRSGELTQLERAEAFAMRRQMYRELHPKRDQWGGDRRSFKYKNGKAFGVTPHSSSRDAARSLNLSVATVNKILRRFDRIPAELRQKIAYISAIANNSSELDCLADLTPETQREVVLLVLKGKAATVRSALDGMGKQ